MVATASVLPMVTVLPAATTASHRSRCAWVAATPVRHHADRPLDDGIVRALWLDPAELRACSDRHRSPLVWRVVEDYLAGRRFPLQALTQEA